MISGGSNPPCFEFQRCITANIMIVSTIRAFSLVGQSASSNARDIGSNPIQASNRMHLDFL